MQTSQNIKSSIQHSSVVRCYIASAIYEGPEIPIRKIRQASAPINVLDV
jgi:hypothetical protein